MHQKFWGSRRTSVLRAVGVGLALAAGTACKGSNIVALHSQTDTFVQPPATPVSETFSQRPAALDILFAVADNPYMCAKQQKLEAAFAQFVGALGGADGGLDFHIGVVTSDLSGPNPGALLADRAGDTFLTAASPTLVASFGEIIARVGSSGSTDAQPLLAAAAALQPPLRDAANRGFLRDLAGLAVIVVDDEDDYSIHPSPQYVASLEGRTSSTVDPEIGYFDRLFKGLKGAGQDGLVSVSAIVGADPDAGGGPALPARCNAASGSFPTCLYPNGDADPAPRTLQVARDTGGLGQSICQSDFRGILSNLGQLLAGAARRFALATASDGKVLVAGSLNVAVGPPGGTLTPVNADGSDGWSFDPASAVLTFNGAALPAPGTRIQVTFDELPNVFVLTLPPLVSSLLVTVGVAGSSPTTVPDAAVDPQHGYRYDPTAQAIVFPEANTPPPGATVAVTYTVG